MIVMKFGGTSIERSLGDVVKLALDAGPKTAVVVSAPSQTMVLLAEIAHFAERGDRDRALEVHRAILEESVTRATNTLGGTGSAFRSKAETVLAELCVLIEGISALRECSDASRDRVASFGARLSAEIVAFALDARGVMAKALDAGEWTITDDHFGRANVLWEASAKRFAALPLEADTIYVHAGFLGRTEDGRPTTLGPNGADYTASLLARATGATELTIWTEVSGVMTGDPSIVPEAYPVPALSYRETLELGGLGLKMLHPRTMIPLIESGIPLRVRNVKNPELEGTRIVASSALPADHPTCVTSLEDMALLVVEGTHRSDERSLGPRALSAMSDADISVWFSSLAPRGNGVVLVVDEGNRSRAEAVLSDLFARELEREEVGVPIVIAPVTVLTLVTEAMGNEPNVAGRFFGTLGALGINVRASSQGASSLAVSAVIEMKDTRAAVQAVHAAFNLSSERVNVLLLGTGTVGRHVLEQLASESEKLKTAHDIDVRVFGVRNSKTAVVDEDGIPPAEAIARLEKNVGARGESADTIALLDRLKRLSVPILIDCTAASGMESLYLEAFRRGIHVVAANKKAIAGEMKTYSEIAEKARRAHRSFRYETTVGASLPVIETLKNLVRTGDRVKLVEGSFSGTLGFLANEIMAGAKLSKAVRKARDLGYTEPHPRDDLSGLDAARKALILARELGLHVELSEVVVEPFIPAHLLVGDNLERFFAQLAGHDETFEAQVQALRTEGRVLRYLAQIDLSGATPRLVVGPIGVPADHPATRLRGSEAFVAFTTERYAQYPLVIQGAGAGGAVTAAGVVADVLALSQGLRGR